MVYMMLTTETGPSTTLTNKQDTVTLLTSYPLLMLSKSAKYKYIIGHYKWNNNLMEPKIQISF
jgi:hypothetical protein